MIIKKKKNNQEDKDFRELINKEYNEEPICYCKRCLSIKIRESDNGEDSYCEDCGSTNIEEANVFEWEKMFAEMYGNIYLDIKEN